MSGLGAGLAPLTLNALLSTANAPVTGTATTVTLVTQSVQIPSATASALPALSSLALSGTTQVTSMTTTTITITGQSTMTGATTTFPSITANGLGTFTNTGMMTIPAPTSIALTLITTAGNRLTPLNCTAANPVNVQVAVLAATGASSTTTPMFSCTVVAATATQNTMRTHVPMTVSYTGPNAIGMPDTVTLSSPFSSLSSLFPSGATGVNLSGSLPVTGAQTSSIPLTGTSTDLAGKMFSMTGHFMPTTMGRDHFLFPHMFRMNVMRQTAVAVVITCTQATAMTATNVMVNTTATPSMGASSMASAATGTGTNAAPNTGGGGSLHSSSDMPAIAGGVAALVLGSGITFYAIRRRRGAAI